MTKELQNLLSLLESPNKENRDLGDILAKNFQKEFKEHFDCEIGQHKKLIKFLIADNIWNYHYERPIMMEIDELHLASKMLNIFPKCLCLLKNLFFLDLSNNAFQIFPPEVTQFPNLQKLDLAMNYLGASPLAMIQFGFLPKKIKFGLLEIFPKEIGQLQKLVELDLSRNKLQNLPKEIGNLVKLEVLYLHNNKIEALPKELAKIKTLQKIYIQGNPANMFIPDELKHLVDFGSGLKD